MKILALTDIHGAYAVAETIIRSEPADVVILGGDLTNIGKVRDVEGAINGFRKYHKRILAVAGNLDLPEHDEYYSREGMSLNGRGVAIGDIGFFGVSAAPHSPLHTVYEISEEQIADAIRAGYAMVKRSRHKVLVSHAPPFGTKVDIVHGGYHVGSRAVFNFIELAKPALDICGHIHEGRGRDTIINTTIVNCGHARIGQYAVIEISDDGEVDVRLKEHKPKNEP